MRKPHFHNSCEEYKIEIESNWLITGPDFVVYILQMVGPRLLLWWLIFQRYIPLVADACAAYTCETESRVEK